MRQLSIIEIKEVPQDDPAILEGRHPDSRARAAFPLHLPLLPWRWHCWGVSQVVPGLYNSLEPGWGTEMDSEPKK